MRFSAIASALFLGAVAVSALPTGDIETDFSVLEARDTTISFASALPNSENCPATNNGPDNNYGSHSYSQSQLKAAILAGAQLLDKGRTIGENKYPHSFGNREKLEFNCGKDKAEFPILLDGSVYTGGEVKQEPDRVVFEHTYKKIAGEEQLILKFCGVIRHGPKKDFLNCHA